VSFPARFGTADVMRRLGITDPQHFAVGSQPLQGTIQVLDLSKSVATDPVEARAYVNAENPGLGGLFTWLMLWARSAGGLVVERLSVETAGAVTSFLVSAFPINPDIPGSSPEHLPLNIGGVPVRSTVYLVHDDADRDPIFGNWELFSPVLLADLRIFVPSGSTLVVANHAIGAPLRCAFSFREIQ